MTSTDARSSRRGPLPLKRLQRDPRFWAKLLALWHRERVRAAYLAAGVPRAEARHRSNDEALEVAHRHGWRGDRTMLKAELAELLTRELPELRRRDEGAAAVAYWEDQTHADMIALLSCDPEVMRAELVAWFRDDAQVSGSFTGHRGLYRLAYVVGYVPAIEHLVRRNAFLAALSEIGQDRRVVDRDLFRMVLRFSRPYTLQSFETRVGEPMPRRAGEPRKAVRARRRGWLDWLRP